MRQGSPVRRDGIRCALRHAGVLVVLGLAACGSVPPTPTPTPEAAAPPPLTVPPAAAPVSAPAAPTATAPLDDSARAPVLTPAHPAWQSADAQPLPAALRRAGALWQPVRWAELPGWGRDTLHEAWNAWLRSCERPAPPWGALCADVRRLTLADETERHGWMMQRLQPYRVLAADGGNRPALLTGYYEPLLLASRERQGPYQTPLYAPPPALAQARGPWYSRQQIDSDPALQAQLQPLVWLADPLDALLLQIQGSGRLRVREPDGRESLVRLAFDAHNGHPYQSVGRWLLQRGEIREGTWEAIRAWADANPQRLNELLWVNPRVVFFREEPLSALDAQFGPRGAQGVALTPGRSVAVDRDAIPYGTPLWLVSDGPTARLQRLVLAQDTGAAIVGAVRADFFAGWGDAAYALAAGMKQPLQLWALWPRNAAPPAR
ncbi:Membrane-bound lytic murein transglycosylase A [Tepidimonas charontis]|uniref:peptidoglycan lytic exotransglycosylase n=2 Tax=Tepidimonas charontis TaxID=2267262 RepID=A0A554XB90_9BURK|nr:Membrane-bound lytic murein transglycosylase A [Tepidimonas charontis]